MPKHKRKPPADPREQARRKAWGMTWGRIMREHAQQIRRSEGRP